MSGSPLFALGGIGAALSPTIEWLVAFRFLQGLGACAGMVIPRAIVRDMHTGTQAAKLMSLLMLVFSVSPILAPLTGSFVIEALRLARRVLGGDRGGGAGDDPACDRAAGDAPARKHRAESGIGSALASYALLLRDRNFLGLTFIGAFGISSFFVYLASSSFVLIDHYGLTPSLYSVFFSINAVAFIGMSQLTGTLAERFGLRRVVRTAVVGYAATMVALALVVAAGFDRLDVLAAMLFVGYGFLGLVIPSSAVLALEEHGPRAGTASALMGTLQFATGAAAMAGVGLFFDGTSLPMVIGIALLRRDVAGAGAAHDPLAPRGRHERGAGGVGWHRF